MCVCVCVCVCVCGEREGESDRFNIMPSLSRRTYLGEERERELVSWCFEPNQPQRVGGVGGGGVPCKDWGKGYVTYGAV